MKKYKRIQPDVEVQAVRFLDPEKLPAGVEKTPNHDNRWRIRTRAEVGNWANILLGSWIVYAEGGFRSVVKDTLFADQYKETSGKALKGKKEKPPAVPLSRPGTN
tara:strand:+ start:2864 stop:3178 length:315 start_codon:yes stop_codon:yes gene_type:complete